MPYVSVKTNVTADSGKSQKLLGGLSQLLAKQTGKPEQYVMAEFTGGLAMLFAGSNAPLAFVECKSIGLSREQAKSLSAAICHLLGGELQLPADRIYIEFSSAPPEFWGWNGVTFG